MRSPIPPTELSIKKSPTQKNLFLVPSKYLFLLVPREDKRKVHLTKKFYFPSPLAHMHTNIKI